ncbi:MAG: sulfite exporter TauE/SafE family protein [bacterium]|nr:sulfite exporter TauE/SafE family protein [bacterium]
MLLADGAWLGLAFALGLVHAFDADHVMALSVLASEPDERRGGLRAGLRWALGHGAVLLAIGALLFVFGWALPEAGRVAAERLVGVVMIGLGLAVFWRLARRDTHLHFHRHDGIPPHAHWHVHAARSPHPGPEAHQHEHTASLVGALHGLAGSAPVLALLPASARSPLAGLAYLLLFSLGVGLAMALASGLLGTLVSNLARRQQRRALQGLRAASGAGSIAIGGWLALVG